MTRSCTSLPPARSLDDLLSLQVPRYTSYPTAPNFRSGQGAALIGDLIRQADENGPASLYAHVPFCDRLCWFCGCQTKYVRQYKPVSRYVDFLLKEMALVEATAGRRIAVSRMHWGGGSPSILNPADAARLRAGLENHFALTEGTEISVEIDPNDLPNADIAALRALGLTRASIGVQDFDETVQQAINRPQGFEETRALADAVRENGATSLNIDILYGLPHQTLATLSDTIAKVLAIRPDRIALFGYAHVPWMKKHQRMIPSDALPDSHARFDQAQHAAGLIEAAGYEAIGIDHFALPQDSLAIAARKGSLRRNFQGYTADNCETLIGLGASAISASPSAYVQNRVATGQYEASIRKGELAADKGCSLGIDDRIRGAMIAELMCTFALDFRKLANRFGSLASSYIAEARLLANSGGMCRETDSGIAVRADYRPFVRIVASQLDAYFGTSRTDNQRFSRAV